MKLKNIGLILFFVSLNLILFCSCNNEENADAKEDVNDETEKAVTEKETKAIPVRIKTVELENLVKIVESSGTITSDFDVTVVSQTAGQIVRVDVALGQKVKKGDLLVRVDTEPYKIAMAVAKSQYTDGKVVFEQAELEYKRAKSLHKSQNISDQLYDQARFAFERSKAGLAASKATLDKAKRDLRLASVRAPFSGEIAARLVKLGDTLAMGSPVVQLVNRDKLKINVGLSEDDISGIHQGQKANITIPTLPSKANIIGTVESIGVKAIQPSMTYPVEIVLDNQTEEMRVGMVARASIQVDSGRKAIVVPLEKLVDRFDRFYIYTVKDDVASEKLVKLGARQGRTVEILEGISIGDVMVVEGQNNLKDGSKLNIVE